MPAPTPNFDPVAGIYRWAEYLALGPLLQRTRTRLLAELRPCRNALVLGDGDGRFLARLLEQNPTLHALAVDTSARMLHRLRTRCEKTAPHAATRLRTLHASALGLTPPPATDLIVSHFFLDCLTQPELHRLAHHLAGHTAPGTLWLLSDFALPRSRALRPFAALYIRSLYLAFAWLTGLQVTTLPDPQHALQSAGFRRVTRHDRLGGLLYTELWRRADLSSLPTLYDETVMPPPADNLLPDSPADPLPAPEPAVPSLPAPDPGIFHHQPASRPSIAPPSAPSDTPSDTKL